MLEVVDPGVLATVQDRGRRGLAGLGVPPSGACDPWGLAVANLLAGAPPDAAVVEVTLGGTELRAAETCAVALGGADLGAERDDGIALATGAVHRLPAGAAIRFVGSRRGCRAYLALAGGVAAERRLGSAATCLQASLGGIDGRALRAGDVLVPVRRGDLGSVGHAWPRGVAPDPTDGEGPVRFVPGPDLRHLPADAVEALAATPWTVGRAADRMGLRLEGRALAPGGEILSHPVLPGAIQVPGDGLPLVLLADGPTIGGYPVLGGVVRADLPRLGQLRPGDALRLAPVTAVEARRAWVAQQRLLGAAADVLDADAVWLRLPDHAGG